MVSRWMGVAAVLAAVSTCAVDAQRFDPRALKGPKGGPANAVMVLGTHHLAQLPVAPAPEWFNPLLERLSAWAPQAIAVEDVSGTQCDFMRRYPARYRDSVDAYCWDPKVAQAAVGLDVPAATEAVEKTLAAWPRQPDPSARRHLAALFLAAGEPASALVQWLRLGPADRHAGDGLDPALVGLLDKLRTQRGEVMQIAVPLAVRLGLERVYGMDDHTADAAVDDEKAYGAAISRAWDNPASARRNAMDGALEKRLDSGDSLLALYRTDNAPETAKLVFDSDFGAALEEKSPQRFGRQYVAYWETRNLRMASNIREMLGTHPGMRALVIVGMSHKPYLDAYLDEMHDVQIVSTDTVLR